MTTLKRVLMRELAVLDCALGFTSWVYRTRDPAETLEPGFFTDCADMMNPGDQIIATGRGGMKILWVQSTDPVVVVPLVSAGG